MLFSDTYNEIISSSKGIYSEKGSRFIAYSFIIRQENEIKKILTEIKSKHKSANHHCYAFTLYQDRSMYGFNDDGEPKYTAGKPILKQIQINELTNILIIVVRYFGGVKLGISGLIKAYKTAAMNAIANTKIITQNIQEKYIVLFKYTEINIVMSLIKEHNLEVLKTDFQETCKVSFLVPKKDTKVVLDKFKRHQQLKIT